MPQDKNACWVCGRRHEGKCAWFAHPDKGTKNVPWAKSEAGKRQIDHKVAATQGALQVLNVYKHWTGTKHEDYSKEEVDRLKIKMESDKPGHRAKGKTAEMLLNVTEVGNEKIDNSNPSSPPTTKLNAVLMP